jgi:hypothetical protein
MTRFSMILAAAAAIALGACGKKEEPPPPKVAAKPTAPPAVRTDAPRVQGPQRRTDLPEPPPPPPVSVGEISLGKFAGGPDKKVELQSGQIQASDKLFAQVATAGAGQVMIKVRWNKLADGKAVLITEAAKGVDAKGPETHVFEVHNAEGWQPGEYQVEVFVNDHAVATRRFGV